MGAETFRLCRRLLDGVVLVDNSAISAAIKVTRLLLHRGMHPACLRVACTCWQAQSRSTGPRTVADGVFAARSAQPSLIRPALPAQDVFNETRSILEPAGAVAVAGAKAYLQREGLKVRLQITKVPWLTDSCSRAWRTSKRGRYGQHAHL